MRAFSAVCWRSTTIWSAMKLKFSPSRPISSSDVTSTRASRSPRAIWSAFQASCLIGLRDRQALEDREHRADQHEQRADGAGVERGASSTPRPSARRLSAANHVDRREVVAEHDVALARRPASGGERAGGGRRLADEHRVREHAVARACPSSSSNSTSALPACAAFVFHVGERLLPALDGDLAERGARPARARSNALQSSCAALVAVRDDLLVEVEHVGELEAVVLLAVVVLACPARRSFWTSVRMSCRAAVDEQLARSRARTAACRARRSVSRPSAEQLDLLRRRSRRTPGGCS